MNLEKLTSELTSLAASHDLEKTLGVPPAALSTYLVESLRALRRLNAIDITSIDDESFQYRLLMTYPMDRAFWKLKLSTLKHRKASEHVQTNAGTA
jgi:hypothetical protein